MDLDHEGYLPSPKVDSSTRWAYADCPGLSTDDLMRSPDAPTRGLPRMPDRRPGSRTSSVTRGYIVRPRPDQAVDLRPWGATVYVGPKARAARAAVQPTPVVVQRVSKGLALVDQAALEVLLRKSTGIIRMGDFD
jgi:hypothetical protein